MLCEHQHRPYNINIKDSNINYTNITTIINIIININNSIERPTE